MTFGAAVFVTYGVRELESYTNGASGMAVAAPDTIQLLQYTWGSVAVAAAVAWLLLNGWFGRSLRAVRDDAVAASMFGLSVRRTRLLAFVVSAPFATVGGVIYGQALGYISPEGFNVFLSLGFIVIVVLGGVTSLWGALLGSALWVLVPEWTAGVTGLYYILFGFVVLLLLRWAPDGLAGLVTTAGRYGRALLTGRRPAATSQAIAGSAGLRVTDTRKDTVP